MIYYPISTLLLAGIVEFFIITRPEDISLFQSLLGNGNQWGVQIKYGIQENPNGIAQALLIANEFIGQEDVVLILGDNIFYGNGLIDKLKQGIVNLENGFNSIYTYHVMDPQRFGIAEFDDHGNLICLEEKPKVPRSNLAITGIYFYKNEAIEMVKKLIPSQRGELEITDLNKLFLSMGKLKSVHLGRGFAWLDTGTFDSLLEAASFIYTIENRQGFKISVPEEIAFRLNLIDEGKLNEASRRYGNSPYGDYLRLISYKYEK